MADGSDDPQHHAASGQQPPNWGSAYPPPPPPAGYPVPGQHPYATGPVKHPQATTAMVLGILGLVVCGFLAPFAWWTGAKAVRQIDAAPWTYGGRSEAMAGKVMGIIGTVLLVVMVLAVIGLVVVGFSTSTSP